MSKRHYVMIADILIACAAASNATLQLPFDALIGKLAGAFAADNSMFDAKKFKSYIKDGIEKARVSE